MFEVPQCDEGLCWTMTPRSQSLIVKLGPTVIYIPRREHRYSKSSQEISKKTTKIVEAHKIRRLSSLSPAQNAVSGESVRSCLLCLYCFVGRAGAARESLFLHCIVQDTSVVAGSQSALQQNDQPRRPKRRNAASSIDKPIQQHPQMRLLVEELSQVPKEHARAEASCL